MKRATLLRMTPRTVLELSADTLHAMRDVPVVSQAEAEDVDIMVCNRVGMPTKFADNEYGQCFMCDHAVYFRPHAPKKPKRICVDCAVQLTRAPRH